MFGFSLGGDEFRSRHLWAIVGLAALIGAQGLAGGPLLKWLLVNEVRNASTSWATHIFKQIDAGVAYREAGARETADGESSVNLAGALEAALRAGVIHRAVIMNAVCTCQVEIDSRALASEGDSISARLHAFFSGRGDLAGTTPSGLTGPDWHVLKAETGRAGPRIAFVESDMPGEPRYGAEATYFRDIGGEPFALSLTIDVTRDTTHLQLMLTMGALILTVTLSIAAILVTRAATRSSRALRLSEKQARFLAEHDPMTGLLNRFGFGTRAAAMLKACEARGAAALLFQVDADKFKEINDIYGHATGDRVIQAIGQMLKSAFPESALVARLGGDEFAVLVPAEAFTDASGDVGKTLPTGTDVMSDDGGKLIEVSTSIGVAAFPKDARSLGDLMKAADLALYSVKAAGRNAVGAYRRDMTKALERRHWELEGVREAIRRGNLVPYYQPLISARDGRIVAVEALARWRHPTYGVLTPERFCHALEDPRVATEITREMLLHAADDLRVWRHLGYDVSVGLNIGESDLRDSEIIETIAQSLIERDLPPDALSIEVTETALTRSNSLNARPLLEQYRAGGGYVSLDDFGTGGSSITLLKDIPYTSVKIDRSFIQDLTSNKADLAIVRSLVRLSRELGFKLVAEGIETAEQAKLLRELRVDMLQGYLYSRPLPSTKLTELMEWASPPRKQKSSAAA